MSGLRGTITLSIACTLGLDLALGLGCASTPPADPGPGSATPKSVHTTADGLELVEDLRKGALYIKPDHGITPHYRYHLSQVLLTYDYDSPRFSRTQEDRMRRYVEDAAIGGMIQEGATMVTGPGSCVLSMGLGLVDIALKAPKGSGATTSILASSGAITLVVDLRDSLSGEPLLRYGRRIGLPGGIQWQDSRRVEPGKRGFKSLWTR